MCKVLYLVAAEAIRYDGNGADSGHFRTFKYGSDPNMWVRLGQDLIRSAPGDSFGKSVALSTDGSIVTGGNGNQTGSVRVYEI